MPSDEELRLFLAVIGSIIFAFGFVLVLVVLSI